MTEATLCPTCDRPLATHEQYEEILRLAQVKYPTPPADWHLCWRTWDDNVCRNPPVDWRARALEAESDRAAVCTALMWAAAELRARGMTQTADRLEVKARFKV